MIQWTALRENASGCLKERHNFSLSRRLGFSSFFWRFFFFFFFWRYYSRSVAACVCHLVTSCAWTMRNLVWVLISRQSGKFNANQAGTVWVGVTHYMHDLVSVNDVSVYILIMHVMGWQSVCRMTVGFIRVCVQRVGDLERLLATPVSDTTTIWKTTSHIYGV